MDANWMQAVGMLALPVATCAAAAVGLLAVMFRAQARLIETLVAQNSAQQKHLDDNHGEILSLQRQIVKLQQDGADCDRIRQELKVIREAQERSQRQTTADIQEIKRQVNGGTHD